MNINRRALLERWWMLPVAATLGAFGFMGYYARQVSHKREAGAPQFVSHPPQRLILPGGEVPSPLSTLWGSLNFEYAGVSCVLIHLPQPAPGSLAFGGQYFVAFNRTCTHLGCAVNMVRNPEILAFSFNYRPPDGTPQLGCPCHFSVFDPLHAGEAVFGKAHFPLARVRLEVRSGALWATGMEQVKTGW